MEGFGCHEAFQSFDKIYRCIDCGVEMHKHCLRRHCAQTDEKDAQIAVLEAEVKDLQDRVRGITWNTNLRIAEAKITELEGKLKSKDVHIEDIYLVRDESFRIAVHRKERITELEEKLRVALGGLKCGEISLQWATDILLKIAGTGSQLADVQCALDDLNKIKEALAKFDDKENG